MITKFGFQSQFMCTIRAPFCILENGNRQMSSESFILIYMWGWGKPMNNHGANTGNNLKNKSNKKPINVKEFGVRVS